MLGIGGLGVFAQPLQPSFVIELTTVTGYFSEAQDAVGSDGIVVFIDNSWPNDITQFETLAGWTGTLGPYRRADPDGHS